MPSALLPEFIVPSSTAQARAMQEELRSKLCLADAFGRLEVIAGVDVGYDSMRNLAHAAVVTMSPDKLEPMEYAEAFVTPAFPYVPGLLSFREIPTILAA